MSDTDDDAGELDNPLVAAAQPVQPPFILGNALA